ICGNADRPGTGRYGATKAKLTRARRYARRAGGGFSSLFVVLLGRRADDVPSIAERVRRFVASVERRIDAEACEGECRERVEPKPAPLDHERQLEHVTSARLSAFAPD